MIHAAGIGVTLFLIGAEPEDRDPVLSETTREAILAAVTTGDTDEATSGRTERDRLVNRAVALGAILPEAGDELSPGELASLSEWLDRLTVSVRQPTS